MTDVIMFPSSTAARDAGPEAVMQRLQPIPAGFRCVYLTSSAAEAERADFLVGPAHIRIHHASRLDNAEAEVKLTGSRVLLTNVVFVGGTWKDALRMTLRQRPSITLVVAARLADERLWLSVLEGGAYNLIRKPFRADELRRILENAHSYSTRVAPLNISA